MAAEISTAGLRKPVGEIYPSAALLAAFHRHGVPITTASDAHEPHLVGEDLDLALALARAAGYDTVSVFEGRTRRQEPLGLRARPAARWYKLDLVLHHSPPLTARDPRFLSRVMQHKVSACDAWSGA